MTIEAGGQVAATSGLTTVTGNVSADTKGSWVELIASTSIDAEWMNITFSLSGALTKICFLVDIGVGAAASESVIVSNIPYMSPGDGGGATLSLPITIASGSRISARIQQNIGSRDLEIGIHLSDVATFGTAASCITLGADTTNSIGTVVDPGGVANTKGSWVELAASTSADVDFCLVCIGKNENTLIGIDGVHLVDIGTGAAASETVLIPDITFTTNNIEVDGCNFHSFFAAIPSGTRVAARSQSNDIDATDRLIDVAIIGCNMTAPSGGGAPKQAGRGGGLAG